MLNLKKLLTKMLHVPTITATVTGGTLQSVSIKKSHGGVYIGNIQVTTTASADPGQNLFTATVKLDGENTNGFGVSFNGRNPIIALLTNGTLTVRNASQNTMTSGMTHSIQFILC